MRTRNSYKFIVAGVVFFLVLGSMALVYSRPIRRSVVSDYQSKSIETNLDKWKKLIEETRAQSEDEYCLENEERYSQLGITSHHLPTAVSLISDFYMHLKHSSGPRDVFVVLGPDHFERGYNSISTTFLPFATPFGKLETENSIVEDLLERGVRVDDQALRDHSIGVQAVFIKLFFPQARIVPLIFRVDTQEQVIDDIADVLSCYKDRISVIASVDFSHYRSSEHAQALDAESERMISGFDFDHFTLDYVDSPPTMKLVGKLIDSLEIEKVNILEVANSSDFTGREDNTTGYISALLYKRFVP